MSAVAVIERARVRDWYTNNNNYTDQGIIQYTNLEAVNLLIQL